MNTIIPPPLKLLRPSQLNRRYILEVVQNPLRARCCGFGDKDRRPIDPPPILQLTAKDENGNYIDLKPEDTILFLVQCELYNKSIREARSLVHPPWSIQPSKPDQSVEFQSEKPHTVRNLLGSSVSNAYHLYDENNKPGIYFIFNDLSVRTEGVFTLKFVFVDLAAGEPLTMSTHVQQEVFSAPFTVYPAKKFPGLTDSTGLSKCFAKQGIKIAIRTDTLSKRKPYTKVQCEEDDDDEEEEEVTATIISQKNTSNFTRLSISNFLSPPPP